MHNTVSGLFSKYCPHQNNCQLQDYRVILIDGMKISHLCRCGSYMSNLSTVETINRNMLQIQGDIVVIKELLFLCSHLAKIELLISFSSLVSSLLSMMSLLSRLAGFVKNERSVFGPSFNQGRLFSLFNCFFMHYHIYSFQTPDFSKKAFSLMNFIKTLTSLFTCKILKSHSFIICSFIHMNVPGCCLCVSMCSSPRDKSCSVNLGQFHRVLPNQNRHS